MKNVIVKQMIDNKVPTEVLAESIVAISKGMKEIRAGRLNDKALAVLIKDATGISQSTIRAVLDALQSLETTYIRRPAK